MQLCLFVLHSKQNHLDDACFEFVSSIFFFRCSSLRRNILHMFIIRYRCVDSVELDNDCIRTIYFAQTKFGECHEFERGQR